MQHTDKHHVSRNSSITVLIQHREHQELHSTVPINTGLSIIMRKYDRLVKMSVILQNWNDSFIRDFDEELIIFDSILKVIVQKKSDILNEVKKLLTNELKITKKGLGIRYLAGLLAYAHPNRFPTIGRYLYYCGYTGASKITKRYNRKVKSLVYQTVLSMVRKKDNKYYKLYLEIKSKQPENFSKIKKHRIAINRVGTLFLKDFYFFFHNKSIKEFI